MDLRSRLSISTVQFMSVSPPLSSGVFNVKMTNLLEPKAVQWKKSCLVSKGNKNGEFSVSSSAQAGKLAADSTRGS